MLTHVLPALAELDARETRFQDQLNVVRAQEEVIRQQQALMQHLQTQMHAHTAAPPSSNYTKVRFGGF